MANLNLKKEHNHDKQEAIRKIDDFLEKLMQRDWPAGVKIVEPVKEWHGDEMQFSFKGKKSLMSTKLQGKISVTDDAAILDMELPTMVTKLVGEDKIKSVIGKQFDSLFDKA